MVVLLITLLGTSYYAGYSHGHEEGFIEAFDSVYFLPEDSTEVYKLPPVEYSTNIDTK